MVKRTNKSNAPSTSTGWGCLIVIAICFVAFLYSENVTAGIVGTVIFFFIVYAVVKSPKPEFTDAPKSTVPDAPQNTELQKPTTSIEAETTTAPVVEDAMISEQLYYSLLDYAKSLIEFSNKLDEDKSLHAEVNEFENVKITISSGNFGSLDPTTFKGKILIMMLADAVRNLMHSGHDLDFNTKEGFGLFVFMMKISGLEDVDYPHLYLYREGSLIDDCEDFARQILATPEPEETFLISGVLKDYNFDLFKQYQVLMYRYISLIAKCDGVVTKEETDWMNMIMQPCENNASQAKMQTEPLTNDNAQLALDQLVGLASVKQEVKALTNFIKIQKQREAKGMKVSKPSYHCVFTGNPGTGKTTIARILADIYRELGVLKKGHLVETDRSGLVAEYVGQTAVKTNKIVDKALDGVLFIDEAYSLVSSNNQDYGNEAIATLLKRMEDDRERLVVILAGYTERMQQFIKSNPGLQSRFNRYIEFPDYTESELMQIFESNIDRFEYKLTDEARTKLVALFTNAVKNKDANFGNGRFARNIFDKTIELQANRLAPKGNVTVEQLSEIIADDIPEDL